MLWNKDYSLTGLLYGSRCLALISELKDQHKRCLFETVFQSLTKVRQPSDWDWCRFPLTVALHISLNLYYRFVFCSLASFIWPGVTAIGPCTCFCLWGDTVGGFGSRWLQESKCITANRVSAPTYERIGEEDRKPCVSSFVGVFFHNPTVSFYLSL